MNTNRHRIYLHHFFWKIFRAIRRFPMHKYGIEYIEQNPEPKDAFLLVANHTYFYDGFFLGYGIKKPVSYLATDETPSAELFGSYLMNCILTEKGTNDLSAVFMLKRMLRKGVSVGLFPEGDRTWDGRTDELNPNIGRLVHAFDVPVRVARVAGGYLSGPRWAVPNDRRGKVIVEFETIPVETLRSMDSKAIHALLTEKTANNDLKDSRLKEHRYNGKNLAKGIHNLLWHCPLCGGQDAITGKGDIIQCGHCRNRWSIDEWCGIEPKMEGIADVQDWNDRQREVIADWFDSGESDAVLTRSEGIELYRYIGQGRGLLDGGRQYESLGVGSLELRLESWTFIPESSLRDDMVFSTSDIENCVEGLNLEFGFRHRGLRFKFSIPEGNALKYLYFFKLKEMRSQGAVPSFDSNAPA